MPKLLGPNNDLLNEDGKITRWGWAVFVISSLLGILCFLSGRYLYGRRKKMYEYKVETYKVKEAEKEMNKLAGEGWRVIAVSPNVGVGYGIVVTYERKKG